jgi:hypothetical protein
MKMFKRSGVLALLALACSPSMALAHTGAATVSCTGAEFSFVKFQAGSNTVNYKVTVDGTTAAEGTYVLDQAGGTQGHLSVPLTIYDTHRVQAFSWWGPAGTVNGESRPASSPALADQVVHCAAAPPPITVPTVPTVPAVPIAPAAPAPLAATPAAATPSPTIAVAGERVISAPAARLSVQSACAATHARVTVAARLMRQVRFSVKGRPARTVDVASGRRSVTTLVALRPRGPVAQKVTTRITFRNGTRPRTLVAVARRCSSAAVLPKFTG